MHFSRDIELDEFSYRTYSSFYGLVSFVLIFCLFALIPWPKSGTYYKLSPEGGVIHLDSERIIAIGKDSEITIEYTGSSSRFDLEINLERGAFCILQRTLPDSKSSFTVNTPEATYDIKAGIACVEVYESEENPNIEYSKLSVQSGKVEIGGKLNGYTVYGLESIIQRDNEDLQFVIFDKSGDISKNGYYNRIIRNDELYKGFEKYVNEKFWENPVRTMPKPTPRPFNYKSPLSPYIIMKHDTSIIEEEVDEADKIPEEPEDETYLNIIEIGDEGISEGQKALFTKEDTLYLVNVLKIVETYDSDVMCIDRYIKTRKLILVDFTGEEKIYTRDNSEELLSNTFMRGFFKVLPGGYFDFI